MDMSIIEYSILTMNLQGVSAMLMALKLFGATAKEDFPSSMELIPINSSCI